MAEKNWKKKKQKHLNILVMRSNGRATTLKVSPAILFVGFLFGLIFIAVSILAIQKCFDLYHDNLELKNSYEEINTELNRLQKKYSYQAFLAEDYDRVVKNGEKTGQQTPLLGSNEAKNVAAKPPKTSVSSPAGSETEAAELAAAPSADANNDKVNAAVSAAPQTLQETLEAWGDRFEVAETGQQLDMENLQISQERFNFSLISNDRSGSLAQGNLLMVFEVENAGGQKEFKSFPDFDLKAETLDFSQGPAYSIKSSKTINGRLALQPNDRVVAVLILAKPTDRNQIVMKKILKPL